MRTTDRNVAEHQRDTLVRRAQRLEALGRSAAGIAHDLNNILTTILGNVELLLAEVQSELPEDDTLITGLAQIDRAGQRAAALVCQLQALSRQHVPSAPPPLPQPRSAVAEGRGGNETILLCEDEESIRTLAARMLESAGYSVLTADSGTRGLEVATACTYPIHLLLTDVTMPGMDGARLASAIRSARPATKVLYTSGYTASAITTRGRTGERVSLLEKPFTRQDLLERVRAILDEHET